MRFLDKKTIEMMWRNFDVPINDHEEIDDDWCGWERLTPRKEIWRWFDEQYEWWGGIHALMFPEEHKKSKYGEVMAKVNLQLWYNDYAITVKTVEFDCGRALDMIPMGEVEKLEVGNADYDTDDVFFEAVRMNLVEDHDGPFDCYICDGNELSSYIESRKRGRSMSETGLQDF